jgi:hypothetical protein
MELMETMGPSELGVDMELMETMGPSELEWTWSSWRPWSLRDSGVDMELMEIMEPS